MSNKAVRQGEDERNLIDVLNKTRDVGLEVILIIDEAHGTYLGKNPQMLINGVIQPKMVFEISATPVLHNQAEKI